MRIDINLDQLLLGYNINLEILYPVDKLINKREIYSILEDWHFDGKLCAVPYIFFVDTHITDNFVDCYYNNQKAFTIEVEECFELNLIDVANKIFGCVDVQHPGVELLLNSSGIAISGTIKNYNSELVSVPFSQRIDSPETVFQSRNPPHRAHEQIVSEYAPNLLYTTPFVTAKKSDYKFEKKIESFIKMREVYGIEIYVSTVPRIFAGPREALQNCIIFQNLGAKYMIMGRGKNCIGNFYGETESFDLCDKFYQSGELQIKPIWYDTIKLDDTELKASVIKSTYIDNQIRPPESLMSHYISDILLQ